MLVKLFIIQIRYNDRTLWQVEWKPGI